jgi:hypothetical protein
VCARPARRELHLGERPPGLVRLILDHGRSAGFFEALDAWGPVLNRLDEEAREQGIVPVLALAITYLYRVVPDAAEPLIRALERAGATEMRDIATNTYEQAIEKGKELGKQIGLSEGKQIGLSEGKQIGLSEGKQIGLSEGKQIGLQLAIDDARRTLMRMCERRYGTLAEHHRRRIESADLPTLLAFSEDFAFTSDLDALLGGPPT